ncbi:Cysteine-rich receptor-like protein kinase 10, partial [Linum perenne]
CLKDRNYTSGSPFQLNLNLTLASLAANASLYGYFTTSFGKSPDMVYGLVKCSGFTPRDDCQTCASYMTTNIIQICLNQKQGSMYTDECSLQYSDWNFSQLWTVIQKLHKSLSPSAAASPSRIYYGMISYKKGLNIYAMVQWSKDISGSDCLICLQNITASYMLSLNLKQSEVGGLAASSCNLWFDTYQFFSVVPISQPGLN